MNSDKKTARIVGVLFIIATVSSVVSGTLIQSVIESPDDLANVAANKNPIMIGVLLLIALAASVVLIPSLMFPILRKHNEKGALGYFGLRVIEAFTPIIDAICSLLLVTLSYEYVKAQTPNASYFRTLATLLLFARDWAFLLNPIIFGMGALLFYALLYQSKLIPRWLSAWGFIGAGLVVAAGVMGMFANFQIILALPIAVQEMVMAIWLMVKGFNSVAAASKSG